METPRIARQIPTIRRKQDSLLTLSPGSIWRYLGTQSASFWLLNIYVFFEYVRPQGLFPVIDILPWTRVALILTVTAFLFEGNWFKAPTALSKWLLVFTTVVAASIVSAYYPREATSHLTWFFLWVLVYFLIVSIINTKERFLVFMTAFMLYNLQMSFGAVKQWAGIGFRFRSWGLTGGVGWFNNSGDFGVALCMFFAMSIYFYLGLRPHLDKIWKKVVVIAMPVTTFVAIVGSSSRGALLGLAAVALWMLLRTRYRFRGLIAAVAVAIVGYFALPAEQKARLSAMGSDETSVARLTFWKHGRVIANEHPVLGIGYFGWREYYRHHFDTRAPLPHNLFVLMMAEIGYTGLVLLLILMLNVFILNYRTRKLAGRDPPGDPFLSLMARGFDGALVGFMVAGFFDTVTWYPFFWFHIAMTVALHSVVSRQMASELMNVNARPAGAFRPGPVRPLLPTSR